MKRTNRKKDNHLARLQLLNAKFDHEKLSTSEVKAVASHLISNVPEMKELFNEGNEADFDTICSLVEVSPVLDIKRTSEDLSKVSGEL